MQSPVKRMEALVCTKAGSNHIDINKANLFLDSTIKKCVLKIGFHLIKKSVSCLNPSLGKYPKFSSARLLLFVFGLHLYMQIDKELT